jgi:cobalt-zinc-cadmium efflux system outer membrane protein
MRRIALLVGLVLVSSPQVSAQDDRGSAVTLDELYALAASSPRIQAAQELADAGLGDVTAAGTLENPEISYDVMGLLWGEATNGGSQQQLTASQRLPWPGQLDARIRAAQAALAADRSLVDLARGLLEIDLRRAFIALLATQERSALLVEQQAALEEVATIVRGRTASGAARRWDVVRIEAELAAIEAARATASADGVLAAGEVARLLGRVDWTPRAAGRLRDLPAATIVPAVDAHPRVTAARLRSEAADAALARERALAFPQVELRLGYVQSTVPEGGYLYGGFSVPMPFFDQNQGAIERAEHERAAALRTEEAVRAEIEAQRSALTRALELRRSALAEFDERVLAGLTSAVDMARVAYAGGEIEIFELLDSVRTARVMMAERVALEESLQRAVVDALEATLVTPAE